MKIIDDIYSSIPEVNCKGLCQDACGIIACSAIEAEIMQDNGIIPPSVRNHPTQGDMTCSHLTDSGKCAIYEHRPLVCRLFGAVKSLKCVHGCKPKNGYMSNEKVKKLIDKLDSLSDKPHHIAIKL